jgi:hypothetical protein
MISGLASLFRTTNTNTKYFVTIKIVLTIPRNPFAGKPSWKVIFKDYGLTKYEEGGGFGQHFLY